MSLVDNDVDLTLWEPLPEIPLCPDDIRGYALTSIRDTLYISGGCTGTWSNLKPAPVVSTTSTSPSSSGSSPSKSSKGILGFKKGIKGAASKTLISNGVSSSISISKGGVNVHKSFLCLNVATRTWRELPDMNYYRWGHRLAVLEGGRYIYAIGGWGYKNGTMPGAPPTTDIDNDDTMSVRSSSSRSSGASGGGSLSGSIRSGTSGMSDLGSVVSGTTKDSSKASRRKSLNPFRSTKIGSKSPSEPNPADDDATVATQTSTKSVDSESTFKPGMVPNHVNLDRLTSFEIYDTTKKVWKTGGHLNVSRRDFAMCVDNTSGKIYIFGGTGDEYDPNGYSTGNTSGLRSAEVYNPHVNEWTLLKEMPHEKRWSHAVHVGKKIYVFETGRGTLVYDIPTDEWVELECDDGRGRKKKNKNTTQPPPPQDGESHRENKENQEANKINGGSSEVTPSSTLFQEADELYGSLLPKCPPKGKVCASASFTGNHGLQGEVLVFGYPVKEMDGRITDRWMITHVNTHHLHNDLQNDPYSGRRYIHSNRSKSWTVLPPADEFMYYRTVVANNKFVIAVGNTFIAFEIVDEHEESMQEEMQSIGRSIAGSMRSGRTGKSGKTGSCGGGSCTESTYAGSGLTSGSNRSVEPIKDDGTWKKQPNISSDKPPDFRGYAVASISDTVYISGGVSGQGTVYRSFLSYDVSTQKWHKLPGMTHRRLGHKMAATPDGKFLYALGGGDGKTLRSMGVDVYDVENETWTAAPAMNNYRVFFGFTVCRGKIYVFGGVGSNNGNQLASVEVYDPDTNGWEFGMSMPEARGVCNVITVQDVIYVFGTPNQKVLAYDTNADRWLDEDQKEDAEILANSPLPSCPPGGCVCAASSFIGGEVLVLKYPLGGPQGMHRRQAQIYDATKNTWSSVHLLDEFACYSAVVAGDKLVVVTPQNQLQACTRPDKGTSAKDLGEEKVEEG